MLGLAQRSFARAPDWRSTLDLFERDVAADPRHREGRMNLVVAYLLAGRLEDAKRDVDVLAAQDPAREGWHSYLLEPNLRQLVCQVNAIVGRDRDTLALHPLELAPSPKEIGLEPGFRACQAGALERLGRCAQALPLYAELQRRSSAAEGDGFALGAARCALALGRAQEAWSWLARIPPERASASGLDAEIARLRDSLAQQGAGAR